MKVDFILGISWGDEGKGKLTHYLLQSNLYSHVCRVQGSQNAGHTIYHNGVKYVTHIVPAGVFFGVKSIIAPACMLNVDGFFKEMEGLKNQGIDCEKLVKISTNAHIITQKHIEEDSKDTEIGTTKRGVGPCAADRYRRVGIQAKEIEALKPYLVDFYDEVIKNNDATILTEGAQGTELDIFAEGYPYVTSSHCGVAGALLNGIPHTAIRHVYGVAKVYTTYVGNMKFQPEGEIYKQIQEQGEEWGATTGRKRQTNFLDTDQLLKAIRINAVTHLIFNKIDVFRELNCWKLIEKGKIIDLETEDNFKRFIYQKCGNEMDLTKGYIKFSDNPYDI